MSSYKLLFNLFILVVDVLGYHSVKLAIIRYSLSFSPPPCETVGQLSSRNNTFFLVLSYLHDSLQISRKTKLDICLSTFFAPYMVLCRLVNSPCRVGKGGQRPTRLATGSNLGDPTLLSSRQTLRTLCDSPAPVFRPNILLCPPFNLPKFCTVRKVDPS